MIYQGLVAEIQRPGLSAAANVPRLGAGLFAPRGGGGGRTAEDISYDHDEEYSAGTVGYVIKEIQDGRITDAQIDALFE